MKSNSKLLRGCIMVYLQATAPSRVMFLFSCLCMLSMPWLRLACDEEKEDILAVIVMLTTSPYFLFFCRWAGHAMGRAEAAL